MVAFIHGRNRCSFLDIVCFPPHAATDPAAYLEQNIARPAAILAIQIDVGPLWEFQYKYNRTVHQNHSCRRWVKCTKLRMTFRSVPCRAKLCVLGHVSFFRCNGRNISVRERYLETLSCVTWQPCRRIHHKSQLVYGNQCALQHRIAPFPLFIALNILAGWPHGWVSVHGSR